MNQIELEGIVRRAAKGEKQAIEILYNTYREKLYFFVLKNVDNKDLAEDIIEETFLSAMQNINRLKDAKKYESWLYSIAYNKCKMHYRQQAKNDNISIDDETFDIEHLADETIMLPDDYAVNKEFKRELKKIINGLKPDVKSAIILYYYNDMSIKEVAKILDVNETTVKKRLYRARVRIKKEVESLFENKNYAAVPLGIMMKNCISPQYASTVAPVPIVSTSSVVLKAVGITAAAGITIGVPIALGLSDNGGFGIYENESSPYINSYIYYENSSEASYDDLSDSINTEIYYESDDHTSDSSSEDNSRSSNDDESTITVVPTESENDINTGSISENDSKYDQIRQNSIESLNAEKLIGMTLTDALALGDNNYEMTYPTGVQQGSADMYKCIDFPQYCFKSNRSDGMVDIINLYSGAKINDKIYIGMTYNQLCEIIGEQLAVSISNTDLEYSASAVIDGHRWIFSFELTNEQKDELHSRIEQQAADSEAFALAPYSYSVTISDIDPKIYSAVYNADIV